MTIATTIRHLIAIGALCIGSVAQASFSESCLFEGSIASIIKQAEPGAPGAVFKFVPHSSTTLAGSHRPCDYWHGKELAVNLDNYSGAPLATGERVTIEYQMDEGMCPDNVVCRQTSFEMSAGEASPAE